MAESSPPATLPGVLERPLARLAEGQRAIASLGYYRGLFYAYMGITLAIFAFLVPPFQKNDEPAHYQRAVSLTNLDVVCKQDASAAPNTTLYFYEMKRKYSELPDQLHVWDVAFDYDRKFRTEWLRVDMSDPRFQDEVRVFDLCSLPPTGYLPNAAAILLTKPIENPLVGFYVSRVAGALFFLAAIVWSLKVVPDRYRLLVYFYAVIPVILHQVSAVSYDAVHLALFPLIFAYLTRFLVQNDRIQTRDLLIFMALIWWVINIRSFAYVGLFLLFFAVPWRKVAPNFMDYAKITAAFTLFTFVTTASQSAYYLTESHLLTPDANGIDASRQVMFALEHPWHFIAASYRTLRIHEEILFRQGIGVFGWIDYAFNVVPFYLFTFVGGILVYRTAEREQPLIGPLQLLALWGALVLTVASLFLSLYAVWSPVGSAVVGGLQGRYFVGLLPFAIVAIAQTAALVGRARLLQAATFAVVLLLVASIFKAVEGRYYQ